MGKYSHFASGDAEFDSFCASVPQNSGVSYSIEALRGPTKNPHSTKPTSTDDLEVKDINIPVQDGEIVIRLYLPRKRTESSPLLLWTHGGGFGTGSLESEDSALRKRSVKLAVVIVSVEYRLAPEFAYPIGLYDSYSALKWAVEHAKEMNVEVEKGVIVGGTTTGSTIAAALCILARDDPKFQAKITGQVLHTPWTCHPSVYPKRWQEDLTSKSELVDAPFLNKKLYDFLIANSGVSDLGDWRFSPLLAPSHKGLPPTVILIGGRDYCRDDGLIYAEQLKESGVPVKVEVYPGAPHAFHAIKPDFAISRKFNNDVDEGIQWLLSQAL